MKAMTPDRWQRLRALFEAASQLAPSRVAEFLDRECDDDPQLRQEALSLLQGETSGADRLGDVVRRVAGEMTEGSDLIDFAAGQMIGRYRIQGKLGEGGMGTVFVAEDTALGRKVALKVLIKWKALDPSRLERFQREARALAALDHPNIVHIYSVEVVDDIHFLTMQLVSGQPLAELIPDRGLELDKLFDFAVPLADALRVAHEKGIIHRDLKPENVMVDEEGHVKILDFGLAKLGASRIGAEDRELPTEALTREGLVLGTMPYMSPEQVQGLPVDPRTDIFSLGVLLYEMATGSRPFQGENSAALVSSILTKSPPPVTHLRRQLPPRLAQIIGRCLEKDPDRRYQHATAVVQELEALREAQEHHPRISSGISRVSALMPRSLRWRLGLLLSALALVVVTALTLRLGISGRRIGVSTPTSEITSLAVLPLTNLSGDAEREYLADGMTEILITELSKIGALKVISRTSIMRFKGSDQPLSEIAEELEVDAIVEGSVTQLEDRIRITAQLIHGGSDEHLWADSFERDLRDLFDLQREVARAIAQQVEVTLTPEEHVRLVRGDRVDSAASEAYLRGQDYWNRFDLVAAVKAFEEAIELDPDFARAHAGLARARQMQGVIGFPHPPKVSYAAAKVASTRALELDEDLAEAYAVKGFAALNFDFDWELAEREFRRAIELAPGDIQGHTGLAYYLASMGRHGEALQAAERARELDPLSPMTNLALSEVLYYGRDYDRAVFQLAEHWDPQFQPNYWLQSRLLEAKGEVDAAAWASFRGAQLITETPQPVIERTEELLSSSGSSVYWREALKVLLSLPQEIIPAKTVAATYTRLGEKDKAFEWLELALIRPDPMSTLGVDPIWDPLRSDSRFNDLLIRMKLPQAVESGT